MSFTPRQERAISYYLEENDKLRLALQAKPGTLYLTEKATGSEVQVDINVVLEAYDRDRKQAAAERARARRQEQKPRQASQAGEDRQHRPSDRRSA